MIISDAYQDLVKLLTPLYSEREAEIMAEMVIEKLTGERRISRQLQNLALTPGQQSRFTGYREQLALHRPIQYVLREAWFQGMPFYVDERVLIPRPETEELVEWVLTEQLGYQNHPSILDIGTGSGCIPVSIKKKWDNSLVHACDISSGALEVARKNALDLGVSVEWSELNFLDRSTWDKLPFTDIIISNPPYIPQSGRNEMDKHVTDFEPALALFVPDNNALIFYEAIAQFAMLKGNAAAKVFVEIHEDLSKEVVNCFRNAGLIEIQVRRDMQDKERMVRAQRPW